MNPTKLARYESVTKAYATIIGILALLTAVELITGYAISFTVGMGSSRKREPFNYWLAISMKVFLIVIILFDAIRKARELS